MKLLEYMALQYERKLAKKIRRHPDQRTASAGIQNQIQKLISQVNVWHDLITERESKKLSSNKKQAIPAYMRMFRQA